MKKSIVRVISMIILVSILSGSVFVNAEAEVQKSALGNTPENLSNSGNYAKEGEWLYYSNGFDEDKLYKCKLDGSSQTKLSDNYADGINVIDGWIFYNYNGKVYKMKTDGTGLACLSNDNSYIILVQDRWVYYKSVFNKNKKLDGIYRMKLDGKSKTKLTIGDIRSASIYKDNIYYSDSNNLYKIMLDGTKKKTLVKNCMAISMCISDDWIYLANNKKGYNLYKIKTDGTQSVKLNSKWTQNIFVYKSWVYYNVLGTSGYYRMKTDGTHNEKPKVLNDISLINAFDDWFYMKSENQQPYMMKTDLTNKSRLDGIVIQMPKDNSKEILNGEINSIGNTSANLNNNGFAAQQGNWNFYTIYNHDRIIMRQKSNGSDTSHMRTGIMEYINVIGDWIYYCNGLGIAKCKINGSQETQIYEGEAYYIQVVNKYIYFIEYVNNGYKIGRMGIDGSNKKLLSKDNVDTWYNITDGWIYYSNLSTWSLCKMKLDGKSATVVDDYYYSKPVIQGDSIYYLNGYSGKDHNKIYKSDIDGQNKVKLCDDSATNINVSGDWIYYLNTGDKDKLYRMKIDGSEKKKLCDASAINICILGDWIYLDNGNYGEECKSYRMKTDGTQFEELK
jgi:hypothetical protein